jgi:prenyltransferase beta subunit
MKTFPTRKQDENVVKKAVIDRNLEHSISTRIIRTIFLLLPEDSYLQDSQVTLKGFFALSKAFRRKMLLGAAMFTLVAVSMISSVSAISKKDAILNFVNGCFQSQDGYYGTNNNSTAKETTLDSTFAALNLLGILEPPLNNDTYEHVYDIQIFLTKVANTTDGGYRNSVGGGVESVLSTYQALYITQALKINISTQMNTHAQFLLDSQNENGGFGPSPLTNSSPDIISTYYALKALSITGNRTNIKYNMSIVHNFTLLCRKSGSVFAGTSNSTDVSITATYFAIRLFQEFMPLEHDLDGTSSSVYSFLASHQSSSGGFIDPASGTEPLLSSTYYAVAVFKDFAGDIVTPGGVEKIITWIMSKQSYDGGFTEGSTPVASSSMLATNLAVSAIYRIHPSLSDLDADTVWTLTQIAGMIAAIVLIVVIVVLLIFVYYVRKRNRI